MPTNCTPPIQMPETMRNNWSKTIHPLGALSTPKAESGQGGTGGSRAVFFTAVHGTGGSRTVFFTAVHFWLFFFLRMLYGSYSTAFLKLDWFKFLESIWHCLKTFLIVKTLQVLGRLWVEVRNATKPAILSRAVPTKKNQQAPSVAVEKSKKDIQRPALKAEHLCYRRNIASTCPSPVSGVGLHSSPSILPHAPLGFCHSLASSMLAIVNRAALNTGTQYSCGMVASCPVTILLVR